MEEISVVTAIHHPTRRRIVDFVILHQPVQVTTVARGLQLQVGSVSHHLRVLQKAGVVEHVPDPEGDGRTSWWQLTRSTFGWTELDFASPAERLQARESERANLAHQLRRLQSWQERKHEQDAEWQRTAFSSDSLAWATPEELAQLSELIGDVMRDWRQSIDRSDGRERRPVFVFSHGFPTEV